MIFSIMVGSIAIYFSNYWFDAKIFVVQPFIMLSYREWRLSYNAFIRVYIAYFDCLMPFTCYNSFRARFLSFYTHFFASYIFFVYYFVFNSICLLNWFIADFIWNLDLSTYIHFLSLRLLILLMKNIAFLPCTAYTKIHDLLLS